MPALDHLAGLFYSDLAELGTFEEVLAEAVPEPYRTAAGPSRAHDRLGRAASRLQVDVEVLATQQSGDYYSRKIVLHRQSDGASCCSAFRGSICGWWMTTCGGKSSSQNDAARARADRAQRAPRSAAGLALSRRARARPVPAAGPAQPARTTYGRTAFIYCDGYPAMELLEIVAPETDDH